MNRRRRCRVGGIALLGSPAPFVRNRPRPRNLRSWCSSRIHHRAPEHRRSLDRCWIQIRSGNSRRRGRRRRRARCIRYFPHFRCRSHLRTLRCSCRGCRTQPLTLTRPAHRRAPPPHRAPSCSRRFSPRCRAPRSVHYLARSRLLEPRLGWLLFWARCFRCHYSSRTTNQA